MAENSHLYKSDMVPRNQIDAQKKHSNAASSLHMLGRHYGEELLLVQNVQMGRHEDWNQGASYIENLEMPSSDRSLQPAVQNDSSGQQSSSHSNYSLLQQVRLESDKYSNSGQGIMTGHHRTPSNATNISVTPDQQQYYTPSGLAVRQSSARPISSTLYPGPTQRHVYRSSPVAQAAAPQLPDSSKAMSHKSSGTYMESRALLEAVRKRDLAEVERLLDKRMDIINSVETGHTALHLAAQMADVKTIDYLLRRGASVSVRDRHGQTAEYYSTKNNISVEHMLQAIQLSTKQRKHKLPSTALEWRQSYGDEPIIPEPAPYALEVHHALRQYRAYKEKLVPFLPLPQTNSLHEQPQSSLQAKPREETYNKILQDPAAPLPKPPSYYHDRFPSPFEHMLRPAQSSSLTFSAGVDAARQQQAAEASCTKPSRSSEPAAVAKVSSDRSYGRTEVRKSQETNHKQHPSSKFASNPEHKKPSSFRIDDLTKADVAAQPYPPRVPVPDPSAHEPTHGSKLSLFHNDFYRISSQNNMDSQNHPSAAPAKAATSTPFSPYYTNYNSDVTYPITSMVYNPYSPSPAGVQIVSLSKSSPINRQDPHTMQRSHYGAAAHQRTPSDSAPNQNAKPRYNDTYQQSLNSTVLSKDNERKGKVAFRSQNERDIRHSMSRESSNQNLSSSNLVPQASQARPKPSLKNNQVQQLPIDVEASTHSVHPPQSVPPESTRLHPTSDSLVTRNHQDTDMRNYIRQKNKDTDFRPFLHSSSDQFAPPRSYVQPHPRIRPAIIQKRLSEEGKDVLSKDSTDARNKIRKESFSVNSAHQRLSEKGGENLTKRWPQGGDPYPQKSEASAECTESVDSSINRKRLVDATQSSAKHDQQPSSSDQMTPKPKGKRGRKRKHPIEEKSKQEATPTKQSLNDDPMGALPTGNDLSSKREKRPRKSETEDEYLYDWVAYDDFSSTDPENDDSEDEDFRCPIQSGLPSRRGRKPRGRPMRTSSRRSTGLPSSCSFEEPNSDEEESSSKLAAAAANPAPRRGRKPKKRVEIVKATRRGRKKRETSSESVSSSSFLEEKSDTEQEVKRGRRKKVMRVLSSDKEMTPQPEEYDASPEKSPKKTRGRKKMVVSKNETPKDSKISVRSSPSKARNIQSPQKNDKKNEKAEELPPTEKKKKVKSVTKEPDTHPKTVEKIDRRRREHRTRSCSEAGSISTSTSSLSGATSPQKQGPIPRKTRTSNEPVRPVTDPPSKPEISRSLIDLYKRGHFEKSAALKPPVFDRTTSSEPVATEQPIDDQLFGCDLTETEAQVLNAAFQKATDGLTAKDADITLEDATKKVPETPQTEATQSPVSSKTQNAVEAPTAATVAIPIASPEKVKKKRGRKPKSLLAQNQSNAISANEVQSAFAKTKRAALSPKAKLQQKLKEKALGIKAKPTIGGARKGRPPGSLNKNTIKKKLQEKEASKSMNKAISDMFSKPKRSLTNSPATPTPSKEGPPASSDFRNRSRTPLQKCVETELPAASPCSSVASTPVTLKSHLHPFRSRASTPLGGAKDRRTPHSSPLPPNMKKLTCNAAIGETVLHKAVRFNYMDNIEHYLEHGFDVDSKDNAGYTALHEACVHGRLEAAKILLEFGADANINSEDGTRPIHDAVEYDRVEMTRLLLACGADPMLSKFSGRAVKDMIRSKSMSSFLDAYLKELKSCEEISEDSKSGWVISPSSIFDLEGCGCNSLLNPPPEEPRCDEMDFELMEEEPATSYLVEAEGSHGRANYYVLSDVLERKGLARGDFLLDFSTDIKTVLGKNLMEEASGNLVQKKPSFMSGDSSESYIELIVADRPVERAICYRVCGDGNVIQLHSSSTRQQPLPKAYPRGAFCERQTYESADGDSQTANTQETSCSADVPSCSRSPTQSCGNCSSPLSFNSQPVSGAINRPDVLHPSQAPQRDSLPTDHQDTYGCRRESTFNGIESQEGPLRGQSLYRSDRTWTPLKFTDEEIETANKYQPSEVPPYTPTSDLNPIDPQRNDPNRVLTETESAVLSLTMDRSYDPDSSMMQCTGREPVFAKLCGEPKPPESDSKFPLFNNNATELPAKSYNHVSGLNDRDHAIS